MFRPIPVCLALGLLAGAAHAQEREWMLDASDEEAYLIFGVADSDDVGVSLWCPVRTGVVNLFLPRPAEKLEKLKGKVVSVTLESGGKTARLPAKVDVNGGEASASSIEAEIPVDDPILAAMAASDRFSVKTEGEEITFPLYEADLAGLIDVCRKS